MKIYLASFGQQHGENRCNSTDGAGEHPKVHVQISPLDCDSWIWEEEAL